MIKIPMTEPGRSAYFEGIAAGQNRQAETDAPPKGETQDELMTHLMWLEGWRKYHRENKSGPYGPKYVRKD